MFYCDECARENGWSRTFFKSKDVCEICKNVCKCNYVPSKELNSYTQTCTIAEEGFDIWVCNDCGAYADTKAHVEHHASCVPGESARWAKFYEENES